MTEQIACVSQPPHQQTQQEYQQVQDIEGIAYLSQGQGTPILFLHGIGGAARQFTRQLDHFGRTHRAPTYQAIAWDMPGYGASAPLPLVTMDALAASLGNFIAALGLDRPILVGHSIGGMIAQRLLAEAPHAARALILAQTSAAFGSRDPAWAETFIQDRLAPLDAGHSMADLAPAMVQSLVGQDPDPAGLALAMDCIAQTPDSTYRDTIRAMPGFDLRHALPNIAIPTLLISGTQDRNAPPAGMERMATKIPGAKYVALEAVGHLAHLEQPTQFNAAVDSFLGALE